MSFLKNRTAVGVICIVLSMEICFGITPLFNKSISPKTEIVRVSKAVSAGEQITANMVQSVEVGSYNLLSDIFHDTASVVGEGAVSALAAGDSVCVLGLYPDGSALYLDDFGDIGKTRAAASTKDVAVLACDLLDLRCSKLQAISKKKHYNSLIVSVTAIFRIRFAGA